MATNEIQDLAESGHLRNPQRSRYVAESSPTGWDMLFRHPQAPIDPANPYDGSVDLLARKDLGSTIGKLLRGAKGPLVVGLDGAWGTGKTVFLQMLASQLRAEPRGATILMHDAWASDFSADPLTAIVADLTDQISARVEAGSPVKPKVRALGTVAKQIGSSQQRPQLPA